MESNRWRWIRAFVVVLPLLGCSHGQCKTSTLNPQYEPPCRSNALTVCRPDEELATPLVCREWTCDRGYHHDPASADPAECTADQPMSSGR